MERFREIEARVSEDIRAIESSIQQGKSVIPEIMYSDIVNNNVDYKTIESLRRHGTVVIRNVFSREKSEEWFNQLNHYLDQNGYYEQDDPGLDNYFSDLKADKPQICAVYWSKIQVQSRQSTEMSQTRSFLNRIWNYKKNSIMHFDPDRECTYADRIRMRQPGDTSLGLSPHVDGGSVERWLGENYQHVYRPLFQGNWQDYNPFNGEFRTEVEGIDSPAVCRAFRTWQGWTALTPQGPGDGTLQLIPTILSIAYVLLRPFMQDVPEEILCGAVEGRAQAITEEWHSLLLRGLVSIPNVEPGDSVWWHSDVVHAVEHEHKGNDVSSVMYIGCAPLCERNMRYLERQKKTFLEGRSSPDFAPEDFEKNYPDRSTMKDLNELGMRQMGFSTWKRA
tara:strand:- start:95 stop:1270 length:1176 start_codon:yes stop_codon:yes gene_type:complete